MEWILFHFIQVLSNERQKPINHCLIKCYISLSSRRGRGNNKEVNYSPYLKHIEFISTKMELTSYFYVHSGKIKKNTKVLRPHCQRRLQKSKKE